MQSWLSDRNADSVQLCGLSWVDDATNSSVWQRRKLHSLKLRCLYLDGQDDEHFIERMADILPVEGSSALDTLAITKKAFDSLGAPFIDNIDLLPRLL